MYKVCIVIVTWNNQSDIRECIDSVLSQKTSFSFKIIVVDNASSDSTIELVSYYNQVDILRNKKNKYLSPANNQGIKYALNKYDPEFVMVLNPDTVMPQNLLQTLVDDFSIDKDILAVGPKVLFYKNELHGRINSAGLFFDGFSQAYDIGFKEEDKGQYNKKNFVLGVSGVCILYRSDLLKKVGFYWESIPMYFDELELFIRAAKLKLKVLYDGTVFIYHSWMQSTNQNKLFKVEKYKKIAFLKIALRHYNFRSKLAMIKNFVLYWLKMLLKIN